MKNKKFSKWLHRLPVLLTAFLILVCPLLVPAHADVLDGGTYSYAEMGDAVVYLPGEHYSVAFATTQEGDVIYAHAFYSENDIAFIVNDRGRPVVYVPDYANLYVATIPVTYDQRYFDFRDAEFEIQVFGFSVENYYLLVGGPNTSGFPINISVNVGKSAGVLSVFSGVGTWLSGAVQNISTMFWAVESGMTVLGYLAVASLALAVILLIFYLIAGWLKFH